MLANHRRVAPFGVAGGESAARGENWIERANNGTEKFDAAFSTPVERDDVIVIQTPGGGGYGRK
jgi:5-oxoprolinase (ATP-hydrolysing)